MIISKERAKNIAHEMCKPHLNKKEAALKKFQVEVRKVYMRSIPRPVLKLYNEDKGWIESVSNITLDGNGFNRLGVSMSPYVPAKHSYGN